MKVASEVARTKPIVAINPDRLRKAGSGIVPRVRFGSRRLHGASATPASSVTPDRHVPSRRCSPGATRGKRAVVITNAGGFAILLRHAGASHRPDLPCRRRSSELNDLLPTTEQEQPDRPPGDANEKRFEQTFNVLAKNQDCWDIAFVVGFPNLVIGSDQLANQIIKFSEKTENMIVATLLGGGSMERGRKILKENGIPLFEELDFTFRVMGRILWQRFR